MGIKFFCPNGHKLNVKAFLAGKRGICPDCGVKFSIPLESTRGRGAKKAVAGAQVPAPSAKVPAQGEVPAQGAVATVPTPVAPAPVIAAVDPLDASPNAVWYVRPSTGGQYGPANAEVIRRWIAEGRVNAESLVWQAGWADWKKASGVFPKYGASASGSAALTSAPVVAAAPAAVVTSAAQPQAAALVQPSVAPVAQPQVAFAPQEPAVSVNPTGGGNESRRVVGRRKSNVGLMVGVALMIFVLLVLALVLAFVPSW